MSKEFQLFDVVVLSRGLPEHGIDPGTQAAIIDIHTEPTLAYEVEVVDGETGRTVWWGPVEPEDIEPASDV